MCTSDFDQHEPDEKSSTDPQNSSSIPEKTDPPADDVLKSSWDRRSFLKAAALGTAAAALFSKGEGGWRLGGLSASAHNPTGVNCRANDVRVAGVGRILNEPCDAEPGETFTAQIVIPIFNNTGTDRYCATLHLCPVQINGTLFDPGDIIIPGNVSPGTHDYTFEIPNYPANSGLVCFGPELEDGRQRCPDEFDCCTIVSWNTSAQHTCAPNLDPTPSKCRLQQVCIQGFGASLECTDGCDNGSCGDSTDCSIDCGDDLYLCASASGGSAGSVEGQYRFQIYDPSDNLVVDSTSLVASPLCFTIKNPVSGTYRLRATDSEDCYREDTVDVTVEDIDAPDLTISDPDCDGNVTLTASPCVAEYTYEFKEVDCETGDVIQSLGFGDENCQLAYQFSPGTHCVVVTATIATCEATSDAQSVTVNDPVTVSLGVAGDDACHGQLVFTATASGGTGIYTYTFKIDGIQQQSGSSNTFNYGPVLDGECYEISVEVQDSDGCPDPDPADDSITVSQCVETTLDCLIEE
jgi:hypothetical protein